MPPRKRKAQQALAAINEEQEATVSQPDKEEVPCAQKDGAAEEQKIRDIVAECKEQAESKASSLIEAARQRVQHLRTDSELAVIKLTKQVRQTSAADFFKLGPEEAAASTLSDVLQRLRRLQQGGEGGQPEAGAAGQVAATLAAAGAGPSTAVPTETQHCAPDQQPSAATGCGDVSRPSTSTAQAAALMPPPPPRTALATVNAAARAPMNNEVVYSANGSPIYLHAAASSSYAAHGTSTKGALPSIADATPAAGAGFAMAMPPPQTVAFTGQTFRRATAARGRTKQATRAITVTTEDGKSFTVDDVIGLAAVPDKYREEVRRLMESDLQDLDALYKSVATMEQTNPAAAAATTTTGTTRPTRRR